MKTTDLAYLAHLSRDIQFALKKIMTRKEKSVMKIGLARAWQESGLNQVDFARVHN